MISSAIFHAYQNFLMASRVPEYERLLGTLVAQGYSFLTIADLARQGPAGTLPPRTCIVRIDVDSDVTTARDMFRIECALGVRATYYFRLRTLEPGLMRDIAESGSEVGYHYEELATVAKRHGLRHRGEIDAWIDAIRGEFAGNIERFAEITGRMPLTVASHGDWVNRKLRICNHFLIDAALRARFGLLAEAYDDWLNAPVRARFADAPPPAWWLPGRPAASIAEGAACIYLLLHPRQWQANRRENLHLDAGRAAEGVAYAVRCAVRAHAERGERRKAPAWTPEEST